MVKKIFALVMVVSILGVFMGGCSKPEESTSTPAAGTETKPAAEEGK